MKHLLLLLILLLGIPLESFAYAPHGVVVMYHRFEENRYPSTNVRVEQFTQQLDYLQQHGFTIWPLRRLLKALHDNTPVPDKTVALTVDDAYLSVYRHAYPILKQRHIPLTIFVSTAAVDRKLPGFMNWQQMREMQKHGIDFANHGAAHLHLAHRLDGENEQQWLTRIRRDIDTAQQRIDKELGAQGQKLFAYPFGEYNTQVASLLLQMGYIAFGQQSGALGPHSDIRALPRYPINEHFSDIKKLTQKLTSLPLPLAKQSPWEPQVCDNNPPRLVLSLKKDSPVSAKNIHCYLGSGEALQSSAEDKHTLSVQATQPLKSGRSRYNCTAPAGKGRYYWFSQPWFNGADPADPAY